MMSDHMKPMLLETAGTCTVCGVLRCGEPSHLRQVLAAHWEPPLISRALAARLVERLTRGAGRLSRPHAVAAIRRTFRVGVAE